MAARNGHAEIIDALLEAGANVNHKKYDSETPLTMASWNGHLQIALALLAAGANVNHKKYLSDTPLTTLWRQGKVTRKLSSPYWAQELMLRTRNITRIQLSPCQQGTVT